MKTSIKYGFYLGLCLVVGTQILTWLGQGSTNWFVLLTYLFVIGFSFVILRKVRSENDGKLRLLNIFVTIFTMVIISRIIFQIYMFIYTHYIDPGWIETVAGTWTNTMQESDLSEEIVEQRISGFRKAYEPIPMFTVELIKYAVPQIILGLLVSLIFLFRKK